MHAAPSPLQMTLSLDDVSVFVETLLSQLQPGDWVWLDGDLGVGKTTLVQHLAKSLGVNDRVASPTFSLMNVYTKLMNARGIEKLIHLDLYRLKKGNELLFMGLENECGPQAVTLIEWPHQVNEADWQHLFSTTGCHKPRTVHQVTIEVTDEGLRNYSLEPFSFSTT